MTYQRIVTTCGVLLLCVYVWTTEAAPVEKRDAETGRLSVLLQQMDQKLDLILAKVGGTNAHSTRNEDGHIPYRRNEADPSVDESTNEDGPAPYLTSRSSDRKEDVSLRKVLQYLMDMEKKTVKRDHDIPFPA